jgi:homopolymeric O-antigen transport system permease protein
MVGVGASTRSGSVTMSSSTPTAVGSIAGDTTASATDRRAAPSPEYRLRVEPSRGFVRLDLGEIWEYRDLLYFMVWRDIALRYKQTAIGITWTVLQPLLTMLVFTVIFGAFAKIPSDGLPYAIFAFCALVPWTYVSQAISRSGVSLVADSQLVRKVYFPRLIIPLASATAPLLDYLVSLIVLALMMAGFAIAPGWNLLALPLVTLETVMMAVAVGVWFAPLNARYRDIGYTIPFLTQVWFYASPITYPLSLIPQKWRLLYGLNPMVGVIEGVRWAVLRTPDPDVGVVVLGTLVTAVLLLTGIVFFKRMERAFADVI